MTVSTWLRKHDACSEGYAWAVSTCSTMQQVWDTANPEWLIWVATRPGVLDDITLRRFACWCARQVWHLLTDERSRHAVETAERFCDGKATLEELAAARAEALDAGMDAASDAARSTAIVIGKHAALSSAWSARTALATDSSMPAGRSVAWNAAWTYQAKWLRDNATPNFDY
jgi:hypothetical protein